MKNFDIVNVLDTEATCYEGNLFPVGELQEIIEFGITTVNLRTRSIIRTVSIPVVPVMSSVSPFCTELTGWTEAKLKRQGVPYAEAIRRLSEKHGAKTRLLITDSSNELDLVKTECRLLSVANPFGEDQFNVATMFALLTRQTRNVGLTDMLAYLGLQFEGTPHRAGDDSRNIARLFLKLLELGSANILR